MTSIQRFWSHVDKAGPCWLWTAYINVKSGYGQTGLLGLKKACAAVVGGRIGFSHRVAYQLTNGRIPAGFEIDHLCGVRRCVNPAHLEVVTKIENCRRAGFFDTTNPRNGYGQRDSCHRGHPYDAANTAYARRDGARICLTCQRLPRRKAA